MNIAHVIDNPSHRYRGPRNVKPPRTGIDKRPADGPVQIEELGLVGDAILDTRNHGGRAQAVYAYAEEDGAWWAAQLGADLQRPITPGVFGENLTTRGLDVNGARAGARWRVGAVLLEVTFPRIPCSTFAGWFDQAQWVKRFALAGRPGAYLRVIETGAVQAGDPITVERSGTGDTMTEAMAAFYRR